MRIGPYRFRPSLLPTLATLLLLPVLIGLGLWQLQRADEKTEILAALAAAEQAPALDLNEAAPAYSSARYRRARAHGHWDPQHQFLVDNQVRNGVPGYHVLTPLRLPEGRAILVDRGWIPAGADRLNLPSVDMAAGSAEVSGRIDRGPSVALRMGPPGRGPWPQRLVYMDYAYIEQALGYPVLPYLIRLDPRHPQGYHREWQPVPPMGPNKHLGYAVQWFALALTLLVIFFAVNLKRDRDGNGSA